MDPPEARTVIDVADVPDRSRYEATVDGELAGWADYTVTAEMLVFMHTVVRPAFEGRGVGGALARFGLDDVRARGLRALAVCPFVLSWIQRHPEYADLEYRSGPTG